MLLLQGNEAVLDFASGAARILEVLEGFGGVALC